MELEIDNKTSVNYDRSTICDLLGSILDLHGIIIGQDKITVPGWGTMVISDAESSDTVSFSEIVSIVKGQSYVDIRLRNGYQYSFSTVDHTKVCLSIHGKDWSGSSQTQATVSPRNIGENINDELALVLKSIRK